jgi:molybdate transport system permease protein
MTTEDWTAVRLSVQVASCAVLVALPLAVAVGYLLARWRSAGRWIVEVVVNLPLVLPPVVTGYLLLVLLGRNGPVGSWLDRTLGVGVVFTWEAAAIAAATVSFPLMVRAARLAFQGVDVRMEQAARSLGARRLDAFFSVALPLAWRGVLAGAVLGFARSLGEFGATILVAGNIAGETRTIPLAVYSEINRPGGMSRAWPLVAVSVALACGALAASELLERARDRR